MLAAGNQTDNGTTSMAGIQFGRSGLVSLEQYLLANYIMYVICLPAISIVGIIGNSASLYILYHFPSKYAFSVYLKALTTVDILLLGSGFLRSLLRMISGESSAGRSLLDAVNTFYVSLIAGSLLQRLSSALITTIALERFVAVLFPLKVKHCVIEKHPKIIIVILLIVECLLQLPTPLMFEIQLVFNPYTNTSGYVVGLIHRSPQKEVVRQYYTLVVMVMGTVVPFVLVLSTTIAIVVRLHVLPASNVSSTRGRRQDGDHGKMTAVLVALATFFSVCMSLVTGLYMWSIADRPGYEEERFLAMTLLDVGILLISLNSANNFVIYIMASGTFRQHFIERFSRPCCIFRKRNVVGVQPNVTTAITILPRAEISV